MIVEKLRSEYFTQTRKKRCIVMTLDGSYHPDNVFARIIRGEALAVKVWEGPDVLAFMDAFPQSEGHVLVIPKSGTGRNLLDIDAEYLARLVVAVQRVSRAVIRALKPDGLSVMQFNGSAGGQTVFHLHFHVIPRWTDSPLRAHADGTAADVNHLRLLADRITAALD